MQSNVKEVYDLLIKSNIQNTRVQMICKVQDIEFEILNKDIVGNVIQSWMEVFLNENNISWNAPKTTQSYPDFILADNQYMELKCWFKEATPAFDLANFKSLVTDLLINPKRLESDYLVFNYGYDNSGVSINNFWIKKIWELTKIPKTGYCRDLISSQVKEGTIYNLRPYNFVNDPSACIGSRKKFLIQMKKTIDHFSSQLIRNDSFMNGEDWLEKVSLRYKEQVGTEI